MWTKLNDTMQKHDFPKPNFKGFMVDSAQANWNTIKIVYGLGDTFVRMIDKRMHMLFHWSQSLDKHIKQLIKPKFQDQHIFLHH